MYALLNCLKTEAQSYMFERSLSEVQKIPKIAFEK